MKRKQFGETVEGYEIPVLNEREIRAAAGILFLFIFTAIMMAALEGNFIALKFFIVIFIVDLFIRVFINPKYAPSLILGRLIVQNQVPEYVGAAQKLFAWKIGLVLATAMFFLVIVLNSQSEISGLSCFICELFLFFEAAFGICLGCKLYGRFYKEKVQYCPGEVCEIRDRHEIQKTSKAQLGIVFAFLVYIVVMVVLFSESFAETPKILWDMF